MYAAFKEDLEFADRMDAAGRMTYADKLAAGKRYFQRGATIPHDTHEGGPVVWVAPKWLVRLVRRLDLMFR